PCAAREPRLTRAAGAGRTPHPSIRRRAAGSTGRGGRVGGTSGGGMMTRALCVALFGATMLSGGCMSRPLRENPLLVQANAPPTPNPVFLPLGANAYGLVFERVLEAVRDSGFEVLHSNRYSGQIETLPR